MKGLIGRKDVLLHPITVIQGFGFKVFFQTLFAPHHITFLEVISQDLPQPVSAEEIQMTLLLDKLISFELRTSHIYARMALLFKSHDGAHDFFHTISGQEQGHAEILRITKVEVARQKLWDQIKPISQTVIDKIDRELSHLEWDIRHPEAFGYKEALKMVEVLESSEINVVFDFIQHAIQTPFLRKSHKLIPSIADHHSYLNTMLPELMEEEVLEEHQRQRQKKQSNEE